MDSVAGNSIGYVMIYTSHELKITCVSHTNIFSQLSEILLSLTLPPTHQVLVISSPFLDLKKHVSDACLYVSMRSINLNQLQLCIYSHCVYMYTIYMYINVWPALIRSMKKEARRIEKTMDF